MSEIAYTLNDPELRPPEMAQLYTIIGWNSDGTRTASRVECILRSSFCHASARVGGELVGFGRVLADGYCGQILDLMTHPTFRRRGIATEIMRRLLQEASQTLVGVHLIDGSGTNGRLYERFGFQAANHRTDLLLYWERKYHRK